ncbi:SH3 domain-containing protein [Clostridium oryzae]|uniref:Bacterial SH3 domain protein n=1 Tax=Clostridium oryzae TaxID=1450648 RepID=A0A1V4IS87_9CLOT|nr:SH3 domain-containing protein [Clostridium oryzae]OPJ62882.1 bacterial SH3 domain protein [Clostridium oryzae]
MKKTWTSFLVSIVTLSSLIAIPTYKAKATIQTAISRSQVEQRAVKLIDLTWTYNASKNSNIDPKYASGVTLPKQFQGVTTAQYKGIPYDWGGIDGFDTRSYSAPWTNFLDAIDKGAFAGNVNTSLGTGYIQGTAGMDCSGFVQAAFNIVDYKQSTTTLLNNYFKQIPLSDIKHMDILDRPGNHVVIFDKWGILNGVNGAFTYEATPDQTYGGIQGTKRYFLSMNSILNKGYIPARYINILEDTVTQTTQTTQTAETIAPKFTIGGYAQVANVTSYANFRENAGTNYSVVGTIPKNAILNLISYSNGWYKISYSGKTGWVWQNTLASLPSGKYVTLTGAYQLSVRKGPSTTYQIIKTLSQGQYPEKLGVSTDGYWYKIRINGIEGWASKKYLTILQ